MHSLPPLILEPRPSRLLLASGSGAYLLAGVAVIVSSLPLWIKAGLIVVIALALGRFVWQYGNRRGRGFIARLERLDGGWRLEMGDGALHRLDSGRRAGHEGVGRAAARSRVRRPKRCKASRG